MATQSRPAPADRRSRRSQGPTAGQMAVAFAVSWLTMFAHNMRELPLAPTDLENSGPFFVGLILLAAYWRRPSSHGVQLAILGWALLNLIGGLLSVLPLPILPFAPEQSLDHYLTHVVYAVGQLPLVILAVTALRRRTAWPPRPAQPGTTPPTVRDV